MTVNVRLANGSIAGATRVRTLSDREREVLQWVARGKTAPEIGTILGISKRTADFHVSSAVQKLHAANRTHAVAVAIQNLLITL